MKTEITQELLKNFLQYSRDRKWEFGKYTSEFTFQFRFAIFLDQAYNELHTIELESNKKRHEIIDIALEETGTRQKHEIDIDLYNAQTGHKHAIELKFIKDPGAYDIGFYEVCKDIKFLEHLKEEKYGFNDCYCIVFSNLEKAYTKNTKKNGVNNPKRKNFYDCFRKNFCIKGDIYRNEKNELFFDKEYKIEWFDFVADIKVCIIKV